MELNSSKWAWLSDKIYQLVHLLDLVVTLSSQESGCSDSVCQMRLTFPWKVSSRSTRFLCLVTGVCISASKEVWHTVGAE